MNRQTINLQLDCHRVRLQVDREKEEIYRRAAVRLNDIFQKYQRKFPQLSVEQIWVYTSLEVAVGLEDDAREKNLTPVREHLTEINKQIEEYMNQ